jgi:hypothetical protein
MMSFRLEARLSCDARQRTLAISLSISSWTVERRRPRVSYSRRLLQKDAKKGRLTFVIPFNARLTASNRSSFPMSSSTASSRILSV